MTKQQQETILGLLNQCSDLKIDDVIVEIYKEVDFNNTKIGEFSIKEFKNNFIKVITQLKTELESDNYKYLPMHYNFNNELLGQSTHLQNDIQFLINHIKSKEMQNTLTMLNRLIYYQVVNGFWDKSSKNFFNVDEISIRKTENDIQLTNKQAESIISKLNESKKMLDTFYQSKSKELQEIQNSLQTVRNNSTEITNIHTQVSTNNATIQQIVTQQNTNLENINKSIEANKLLVATHNKEVENFRDKAKNIFEEQANQKSEFDRQLKYMEETSAFFEERRKKLDDLIGREVGVSLFETFKQRKNELNGSLKFWRVIVCIMTIVTLLWVMYLFSLSGSITGWDTLLTNSLKSLPAFVLLYFSISQYKKERAFQEEYAFKSAVALTIDEYAKKISNDDEKKNDLIINAVKGVYSPPSSLFIKESSTKPDLASEILVHLKEVTIGLKDVITEMVKKK
jgi:hypothetical protein